MKYDYRFTKSLKKAAGWIIGAAIFLVGFTAFSDVQLWALLETYVRPILGTMTVMGALRVALNYVNYNWIVSEE